MAHKLVNIEPTDDYTGHIFFCCFAFVFCPAFFIFQVCYAQLLEKQSDNSHFSLYLKIYIVKIPWNKYWQCSQTGLWILSKAADFAGLVKAADHYYTLNICQKWH